MYSRFLSSSCFWFLSSLLLIVFIAICSTMAHDYIPGSLPDHPVLLRGGDLYTVSNGIQKNTDLLFDNGIITAIGKSLEVTPETEVFDVSGMRVYPGLIAPATRLGLVEIGAVHASVDISEVGDANAEVSSRIAYNPDSEIIPTVRSNGITHALVVPGGRLIMGRSNLMKLDGWTWEDATEKTDVGLHISWPRVSVITAWWMEQTAEEQRKQMRKNKKRLVDIFDEAHKYFTAKEAGQSIEIDSRWEEMIPLFKAQMPLIVSASDYRQIEDAISFTQKFGIKLIILGGNESLKSAESLKRYHVPIILSRTQSTPYRSDDDYDLPYKLPKLLHEAGLDFCLSYSLNATGTRNLPFQAGQAVAFGLSKDMALRSVTLSPAEILGVDDRLGSLQIGKSASIVVSTGDILDQLSNHVILEFIDGRQVDLDNKQKELYRKYQKRLAE